MKVSKYITACLFFILTVTLNMLIAPDCADLFEMNNYGMRSDEPENIDVAVMEQIAKKHDLILCTQNTKQLSITKSIKTFYISAEHLEWFCEKKLGLQSGEIMKDLLGNSYEVQIAPLSDLAKDENTLPNIECWYLYGSESDYKAALKELKNDYSFSLKVLSRNTVNYTMGLPYVIFGFSLLLLLIYCYMSASFAKKEIAIRVLHGESAWKHYFRFTLTDTLVLSALFGGCCLVQAVFTPIPLPYQRVYWLFIPFLMTLWLVNLHLVRIKPKEMLYGHQLSEQLLMILSVMEKTAAVLSCGIILTALSIIPDTQHYRQAKAFFSEKQDYYFVEYRYEPWALDNSYQLELKKEQHQFFQMADQRFELLCMADMRFVKPSDGMYCNHRALPYLQSCIPEAAEIDLTAYDLVILMPNTLSPKDITEAEEHFLMLFEENEGYLPPRTRMLNILYQPTDPILVLNTASESDSYFRFMEKPVIGITSNTYAREECDPYAVNHMYLYDGIIYRTNDLSELTTAFEPFSFYGITVNAYEKFLIEFAIQLTLSIVAVVLVVMILIFYISVLHRVLELDYHVNAMELAIKKTLGYSVWRKNRKHFLGAVVTAALNCIVALVFRHYYPKLSLLTTLTIPLAMLLLHILLICILIAMIERQKLVKILKGGAL